MEDMNNGNGKLQEGTLRTELIKLFPGSTIDIDTETDTTGKKWYVTIDGGTSVEVEAGKPTPVVTSNLTAVELVAIEANNTANPTDIIEEITSTVTNTYLTDSTKIKAVLTGDVPIPVGANYLEGTVDTGVVIEYKGSQFVWVPVPVTTNNSLYPKGTTKAMAKVSTVEEYAGTTNGFTNYEGILYDFLTTSSTFSPSTGPVTTYTAISDPQPMSSSENGQGTNGYREPVDLQSTYNGDWSTEPSEGLSLIKTYITGYSTKTDEEIKSDWKAQLQTEYNIMIDSVKKYGGFFVGRYESSLNATTGVASIYNQPSMTLAISSGGTWYGMYQKQKDFSGNGTDTLQSGMIWGSQYDAMLNWMLTGADSTKVNNSIGNYSYTKANTGVTSTDIINNIYDLSGNLREQTIEAMGGCSRTRRGGCIAGHSDWDAPAGMRTHDFPSQVPVIETEDCITSRLALYIK